MLAPTKTDLTGATNELALRMPVKEDVPQKLKSLLMEAFSNEEKIGPEGEAFQFQAV